MGLFSFLGRTLFVAYFVFVAFNLQQNESERNKDVKAFTESYPKFYTWVMEDLQVRKHVGQHIPKGFIEPEAVTPFAHKLTEFKVYFLYAVSALIFLGIRGGGFLLSLYQWFVILVLINPFHSKTQVNYVTDFYQVLQQLAITGGALMMCCGFGGCCKEDKKAKKSAPSKSSQKGKKQKK